jgi:guanylate kinase
LKGKLFVISGPSGVGKNTILNEIVSTQPNVQYSVSATSRPMRPGEVEGKSYYFMDRAQFESLIAQDELLEYAEYVGNYYGTPATPIRKAVGAGIDIVMDVDVVGALKIKKRVPDAVLIFMAATSLEVIRQRLLRRGDVRPDVMENRLERARWEYEQARHYDYIVLNDEVAHATGEVLAIMTAEKCKTMERIHLIEEEL